LLMHVRVEWTPNFDDLTILIVPQIIKTKLLCQPVKFLPSLTDEGENLILGVLGHVHLGIVCIRGLVRRHGSSLLMLPPSV